MIFLFSLFLGASAFAAPVLAAPGEAFLKANEAYAAEDFERARQLYSEALVQRPDENAWFNLGNTSFRLNDLGRAALEYERALVLAPHHPEATENLRFLRQKTAARVVERQWPERMFGAVPPAVAPWLAISVTWLGFAWGGAASWRRVGRVGIVGGGILVFLGAAYGGGLAWWRGEQAREAIVSIAMAEAKAEPSDTAHPTERLPAGSRVRLVSTINGWQYCELPSGGRGWLPATAVEPIRSRP